MQAVLLGNFPFHFCLQKTFSVSFKDRTIHSSANMHNYNQQQAVESLHQPLTDTNTQMSHTHLTLTGTMGTFVPRRWRQSWHPKQTATHRATLLALNRKKRTELAKEITCRPGGRAGDSARKAPAGKARLKIRWSHYRNFRFFQNDFPKAESQKFTHRIILRYFTLSHNVDRSNCLFAAQNHQWKPWKWKAHSTGHQLPGFLWKSLQVANKQFLRNQVIWCKNGQRTADSKQGEWQQEEPYICWLLKGWERWVQATTAAQKAATKVTNGSIPSPFESTTHTWKSLPACWSTSAPSEL